MTDHRVYCVAKFKPWKVSKKPTFSMLLVIAFITELQSYEEVNSFWISRPL